MAIQQTAQADEFKRKLCDVLQRETLNRCAVNIARHANVYATGRSCNDFIIRGLIYTGTDAEESLSRREAVQRCDDPRDHGEV